MSIKYLSKDGLSYVWGKIKSIYAPLSSPALTGTPTAPTASTSTNNTQIATTAFVKSQGYLTSHQSLPSLSLTTSGSGNAITALSVSNHAITATKGTTFLTSHQSLDNYVTLNGAQSISAVKTFTAEPLISKGSPAFILKNTSVETTVYPSSGQQDTRINFQDKNGHQLGSVLHRIQNNNSALYLRAFNFNRTDSENAWSDIAIGYDSSGNAYTAAPTPATSDNSTKIATTAFVKAQNYITSSSNITGTAANVTGTVAIANGGTGATTRLNAIKALTNENVSTNATHFLGLKSDWSKVGYFTLAEAKTLLGLKSAAYTESSAYATSGHTHSYLPLAGGTMTGTIIANEGNIIKRDVTNNLLSIYGGTSSTNGARFELYGGTRSTNPGSFLITASIDSSNNKQLLGKPDGTLTWGGTAISLNGHTHSYLPLSGGTLTGTLTGTAFVYKSTNIDRADTTTDSSVENWVYTYRDKNSNDIGNYGVNRYPKTGQNRHRFRLRNTGNSWADLIFEFKDNGQYFLWMTGSSGTTNGGFSGNVTGSSSSCTGNAATASKVAGGISASHVGGCVYGNALVNSNVTSYGAIWNAATKNTRVSMATYPGNNDLVYLLSCTNANVSSNTNTIHHYVTWDANNGTLTNYGQIVVDRAANGAGGSLRIKGNAINYAISLQDTGVTKGTALGSTRYIGIDFYGNTYSDYKNRFGVIENQVTGTTSKLMMAAYNSTTADNTGTCAISVRVDASGNGFAEAPTPASDANDTRIATTKWVKDRAYITSSSNITGTAANVTGTVAIANGGTGATTRLNAVKALTNENVGTGAQHFLTITDSWGKAGYTSVANAKTVLGLKSAAYTESSAYATSGHTHSYLPLSGGTLTGNLIVSKSSPYICLKSTDITKATAPSSNYTPVSVEHVDSAGRRLWGLYYNYNTDKKSYVQLICNKGTTTDNTWAGIGVGYDGSGNWFTSAPTPATADNSTKIATTAFVKAQGYLTSQTQLSLTNSGSGNAVTGISVSNHAITVTKGSTFLTSHQSLSNYVTLNGAQNITGAKVFTNSITSRFNENYADNGAPTSGNGVYRSFNVKDTSGWTMGDVLFAYNTNNTTAWYLRTAQTSIVSHFGCHINVGNGSSGVYVYTDFWSVYNNDCGTSSKKWDKVWATTGSIQTSDKRLKEDITNIPDSILDVWENVSWRQFKLKKSVKEKGKDLARIHSGIIAQDVQELFDNANINCEKYGFFCYDEWEGEEAQYDDKGNLLMPAVEADNQYSIRYEEALCIEAAYQRREVKKLKDRISELEAQLASAIEMINSMRGN